MAKCKHEFDRVSRRCTKCNEHIYDRLNEEEDNTFECDHIDISMDNEGFMICNEYGECVVA